MRRPEWLTTDEIAAWFCVAVVVFLSLLIPGK